VDQIHHDMRRRGVITRWVKIRIWKLLLRNIRPVS
jgi:hypothetical protein